jgi:uracil-DNA glycosylase
MDFPVHLDLLRREIDIVKPLRIVALGVCAEQLLYEYLPEVREKVRRVWHFAYGARPGSAAGFEAQLRSAIRQS